MARLPTHAGAHFLVMWDNAYAVHDLDSSRVRGSRVLRRCSPPRGTDDHVVQFTSTSKITFAGAGVAFPRALPADRQIARKTAGRDRRSAPTRSISCATYVFSKVDSTRTCGAHAELHPPEVRTRCSSASIEALDGLDIATWTRPQGGYFISFDTVARHRQARDRARARDRRDVDAGRRYVPIRSRSGGPQHSHRADVCRVSQTCEAATDVFVLVR